MMSAKPTHEHDPVAAALAAAPLDTMPESDDERRKVAEARASLARGERTYTHAEIEVKIEKMRRRQEGG